jgi:inosose dehydratase
MSLRIEAAHAQTGESGAGRIAALPLSTNEYPWLTFYKREGREWDASRNACVREVRRSGFQAMEPTVDSPEQLSRIATTTREERVALPSVYVGSVLHDPARSEGEMARVIAIAKVARAAGTRIIVTNPSPIRWGADEYKTDQQLELQARNLQTLGESLSALGLALAYHNHDIEMQRSAREFHHMMVGTDPRHVSLCLDAHWVFRGSGDSQVALFDIAKLYGRRIRELHLRQSRQSVWTERFENGDIDYSRLANGLAAIGVAPHVVMEQAVEAATPHTVDAVEAHKASFAHAKQLFPHLDH